MSGTIARQDLIQLQLRPEELKDLANFIYDRLSDTPPEDQTTEFLHATLASYFLENRTDRLKRRADYLKQPYKRTPEFHRQLVGLGRQMGLYNPKKQNRRE